MKYIVGDLHGCYTALISLLERVNFNKEEDYLYFVGDICDRGTENKKLLEFLYGLGSHFLPVFGNHDIWLYQYLKTNKVSNFWVRYNGGKNTYKELNKLSKEEKLKYAEWLGNFPYIKKYRDTIITHNFITKEDVECRLYEDKDIYDITLSSAFEDGLIQEQEYDPYVYDRSIARKIVYGFSNEIKEIVSSYEGNLYIMGHTPQVEGPVFKDCILNIDTGAFATKEFYKDKHIYRTDVELGFLTLFNMDTLEYITTKDNETHTIYGLTLRN